MSLISKQDIQDALGFQSLGFLQKPLASCVMTLLKINKVNALYDKLKHLDAEEFYEEFLKNLNVDFSVFQEDLARIPKTGPFVVVANHPLGAIDGILMCHLVSKIRPDFKIMGNFLLTKIEPMKNKVISVNPFEERKEAFNSMTGMRNALKHLSEGGCMGVFPAGEVSNRNNENNEILDRNWQIPLLRLIKKARIPVVPMYFHAKNSRLFYRMAKINSGLQTLMLPLEMMHKRIKPIQIRIGKVLVLKTLDEMELVTDFGDFLLKKVYMMKSYYERRKSLLRLFDFGIHLSNTQKVVQNIIEETPLENLLTDIELLRQSPDKRLFVNGNYELYFAKATEIPHLLREIGRQRELTFRNVGEGTNLPFDLDVFDNHYHHLILWDKHENKLVGAYRMALGGEVLKNQGIEGFYTSSLFNFDVELQPFFRKVIEMGRAYVVEEYQQKPFPLFLLWRGIIHVCMRNPEYKFLMGGVSISNRFSDFSKSLMIEFMRSHYYDPAVAQYIHPKKEFKVQLKEKDKKLFLEEIEADLNKFDKLIDDFEPQMRMPVLIKKYFKQNAKVVAFNVDPNFNDVIDGLMYIRISDLPESTVKPVLEEMSNQLREESEKKHTENQ